MADTPAISRTIFLHALVLAVACGFLLRNAPADVLFHPDIVRDLLIARNCLEERCASLGSPSSTVFFHGFSWDHFLIGLQQLGIPVARLPLLIGLLHALGLLLFFHVAAEETDHWTAALAAMILGMASAPGLFDSIRLLTLIPPLMSLLIFALHRACSAEVRHPRAWFALCTVLFSLATQWHLEMFLFFPGLLLVLFSSKKRAGAAPAFIVLTFGLWLVVSRDSAAANWRLLQEAPLTTYAGSASVGRALERLAPLAIALVLLSLLWVKRKLFLPSPFHRLLAAGAASYGLGLSGIFTFHFFDAQYLAPLFPILILMSAKLGQPLIRRLQSTILLKWSIPILLLAHASRSGDAMASSGLDAPLSLGEIHSMVSELRRQGLGTDETYRMISSGQALQTDFQSGMWLGMPCLTEARVIGAGDRPSRRVLAAAVPRGFPAPADSRRLSGDGRDLLLIGYEPWVDPARFTVGGAASEQRTLSFENPGYRQARCWDVNLPYAARGVVRRQESSSLTFPVEVPAAGESRVLYLPEVSAQGQRMPGCAARITELDGVTATLAPGAHQVELRPTGRKQRGTITVEWPTHDARCFADGFVFYPMPMAEMPAGLFAQLRPFLDRHAK